MNKYIKQPLMLAFLTCAFSNIAIAEPTPGFNTKIPGPVLTPNELKTKVGTLKFFDGIPSKETAEILFNNLDQVRFTIVCYFNFIVLV